MNAKYCPTCGEAYGDEIGLEGEHLCPFDEDDPGWCEDCGAELTEWGNCYNDHDEDDE